MLSACLFMQPPHNRLLISQSSHALRVASPLPGAPRGLHEQRVSASLSKEESGANTVRLQWQPPSNRGAPVLAAYNIYHDDMLVHTTTHASECCFQDRALRPGSLHTYAVAAVKYVGLIQLIQHHFIQPLQRFPESRVIVVLIGIFVVDVVAVGANPLL